jgi:hypothetical protein
MSSYLVPFSFFFFLFFISQAYSGKEKVLEIGVSDRKPGLKRNSMSSTTGNDGILCKFWNNKLIWDGKGKGKGKDGRKKRKKTCFDLWDEISTTTTTTTTDIQ